MIRLFERYRNLTKTIIHILSRRLDAAEAITVGETRGRQKAEETIEEMKAGFMELERVFGDLPPEIVSLYDIPEIKD